MVRVTPSALQKAVINAAPRTPINNTIRNKQLQLRTMLSDPKAFLRVLKKNKKKGKKKARRAEKQKGGNLKSSRQPINKLPIVYQYYQ
jgi:hypothetical protein